MICNIFIQQYSTNVTLMLDGQGRKCGGETREGSSQDISTAVPGTIYLLLAVPFNNSSSIILRGTIPGS